MKLSGAQAIIKVLLEQGVDTVFGYPGGQVIPLYNALYDAPLRNVLTAHEQGAIHAADGYARASGRTGVCIATSGPGATNIVTGLATAYLDSVPLVAITGQVSVANLGRDSFQEIDIVGVTLPITKYNILVRKPEDLLPALRQAFYLAQEGRPGPVLVDVPSNLQVGDVEWMEAEPLTPPVMETAREEILEAAAVTITNARQPVFLVGGGAVHSGAAEEVLRFARKTGMPVVNTLMGIGVFPGSDRQCLGLTGMHGHIAANMAGGYGENAKKKKAYIIYLNGTVARAKKSDSDLIQPGCEIVVPTKSERKRLQLSEIMGMSSMTATIAAMVATLTNAFK